MHKSLDITFHYVGLLERYSQCRLRVWEEAGKPPVVLFTQLQDRRGTNITDAIERLAWEAYKLLERPRMGIAVVEHYRDPASVRGTTEYREEFDIVTLTATPSGFCNPQWRQVSKEEVEQLLGDTLTN